ncbi:MAG: hypothetical protein COA57_04520 [Flavobacteriales bacterium]|nr:MAG: hypothetical protein COA57_04520 [Flavobacteriales bacterium]
MIFATNIAYQSILSFKMVYHSLKNSFSRLKIIFSLLFVFGQFVVFSQEGLIVEITIKEEKTKLDGVTVTVYKGSSKYDRQTSQKGKVKFVLEFNNDLVLEFSKGGYVSKKVAVSTTGVPQEEWGEEWFYPFEISLFKEVEGLDVSLLQKPIGKISFSEKSGFDYDADYTRSIQSQLSRFMAELERKRVEEAQRARQKEAKYKSLISSADRKFGSKDYEGSKAAYEQASKLKPTEQYPKNKIAEADKLIADQKKKEVGEKAKEEQYKGLVTSADKKFATKDYEGAKTDYKAALGVKPNEKYPQTKISEIDKILGALANKESEAKAKEEKYKSLIASADQKFGSKNYTGAKADYRLASQVKPTEQYPKTKISEIDKALSEIAKNESAAKAKEEKYKGLIAAADKKLGSKDYQGAKADYQSASQVKPTEKYPKTKILEIDKKLAVLAANEADAKTKEEKYKSLISSADKKLTAKDYEGAKSSYQSASALKPNEKYPKLKISEIDKILGALASKEAKEKAKEEKYKSLISSADQKFASKNYTGAKADYQSASGVKPSEQYPKTKISEIDKTLAEIAKNESASKAKEEKYKGFISSADKKLGSKDYEGAKADYQAASQLKTGEQYPKDKIIEIDKKLAVLAANEADAKTKEEQYKSFIASADKKLTAKDYEGAKSGYQSASVLKPNEKYPKLKISEIDKILGALASKEAKERAKEEKYKSLISSADQKFGSKNYTGAMADYRLASQVKPTEQYPKTKISEIDKALAEIAKNESVAKVKEEKYQNLIVSADRKFKSKEFTGAKSDYESALEVKPSEQYPKTKIAEIDKIIANNEAERKKAEAEARKKAEEKKAREEKYNNLITTANQKFDSKDYEGAKSGYQSALQLKSNEKYPAEKIAKIDGILADAKKREAAQRTKEEKYNSLISSADQKFNSKDYGGSKKDYQAALGVKPGSKYPQDKLQEIIEILTAKQKALEKRQAIEKQYKALILSADKKFTDKDYDAAKADYRSALQVKSEEQYPKDKIGQIDKIMAGLAESRKRKADEAKRKAEEEAARKKAVEEARRKTAEKAKQLQAQYQKLISSADSKFNAKDYENAKSDYAAALKLKSIEEYPKQKLAEINTILRRKAAAVFLAKQKAEEEARKKAKEEEDSRKKAQIERFKREIEQQYKELISRADKAYGAQRFSEAKKLYLQAMKKKPTERYPKEKISEINSVINQQTLEKLNARKEAQEKTPVDDSFHDRLGEKYPEGVTEDEYQEGSKMILRRIVVKDGHGHEYKRITHRWGGVFYTKDGDQITQFIWKIETEPHE